MAGMDGAAWEPGEIVVRREVLGLERAGNEPLAANDGGGRVWFGLPVHVVADDADQLVTYIGPGSEFGFVSGPWPTATGRHPWHGQPGWRGRGCLMVQRPGDEWAIWHLWQGADRTFLCWYVNFQAAYQRTEIGFDTLDFELDIVVWPDGTWLFKDREVLAQRVAEGRLTQETVDRVVALGDEMAAELDAARRPWDPGWANWVPPDDWRDARLPADWSTSR